MAPSLLEISRNKYRNRVPDECFLAKVPDWLQYIPDDTIAPSGDLLAEGSTKHLKASKYKNFIRTCRQFCKGGVPGIELRVLIMPYMPLKDAYQLHNHISEPDLFPDTYADRVKNVEAKDGMKSAGEPTDLGLGKLLNENDDKEEAKHEEDDKEEAKHEEDEEEEDMEWEVKRGSILFDDLGISLQFVVTNYSVLYAKAEKYSMFESMTNPLQEFLASFRNYSKVFPRPPPYMQQILEDDVEIAKRNLIFSMYQNGTDPHHAVLSLFTPMHDDVYIDCVHCNPNIPHEGALDSAETLERLFEALNELGLQEYNANMSLEDAKYKLMNAIGLLESHRHHAHELQTFEQAEENVRTAIHSMMHNLRVATVEATMMVSAMNLGDEE